MKKIFKLAAMAVLVLSFASCESFLDTTNYWSKDSSNFPVNATDAEQMLAGIYNNLNVAIGTNVHVNHFLWSEAASDDALGGGRTTRRCRRKTSCSISVRTCTTTST